MTLSPSRQRFFRSTSVSRAGVVSFLRPPVYSGDESNLYVCHTFESESDARNARAWTSRQNIVITAETLSTPAAT